MSKKTKTPKKKQPSPQKTYMPDETGHMVEGAWAGDHPMGPLPSKKVEEDTDEQA